MEDAPIPKKMLALQLVQLLSGEFPSDAEAYEPHFEVAEVDVPQPKSGEVLVRVERSPINPSDLSSLRGSYDASNKSTLPYIPGFEGSGLVVASGGGVLGWRVLGKRVALATGKKGGMWAQYVCVPAMMCMPLPDNVSYDTGASSFVNPLTVLGFLELAHAGGHKVIIANAAASALGKMLIRTAKADGVGVIAIVRKQEQIEELKALGALEVFNTENEGWQNEFKQVCTEHNARLAFDAVAGALTGQILHSMPSNSTVKVYGGLSNSLCTVSPGDFIFQGKKVEGFWLSEYIKHKTTVGLFLWQRKVTALLNSELNTEVRQRVPLTHISEGLANYVSNMSGGKILVAPHLRENDDASSSSSSSQQNLSIKKDDDDVEEKEEEEGDASKGKETNE